MTISGHFKLPKLLLVNTEKQFHSFISIFYQVFIRFYLSYILQNEFIGPNPVLTNPFIQMYARNSDLPPSSYLLRWMMSKNIVVTPCTNDKYHLEKNFFSHQLDIVGVAYSVLDSLAKNEKYEETSSQPGTVKEEL